MSRVSPAQIQVLQSSLIGGHQLANQQQQQQTLINGDSKESAGLELPSHVSELRFTENFATSEVPVFGNLVNNLVKPGTTTVAITEVDSSHAQQQQQNSAAQNSKFSSAFTSKMDQAMAAVKQIPSRMGPWASFFDPKQFSVPSSGGNLKERLKGNLPGFYGNYAVISLILLAYCLITSPLLLIGVVVYGLLAYSIINHNQEFNVFGQTLTTNQQLIGLTICAIPLFLLLGLTGVFFWLIGASTCLIALHAVFHEPPKPEDLASAAENGPVGFSGDVYPEVEKQSTRGGPAFQVVSL